MFAGLPGIGVGTLFYVLMALWMPIPELVRLARGHSSRARWQRVAAQFGFALSIIASIAAAERVLLWIVGAGPTGAPHPARALNRGMASLSPETLLAAPIAASLLLLAIVLLVVQVLAWRQRVVIARAADRPRARASATTVTPAVVPAP